MVCVWMCREGCLFDLKRILKILLSSCHRFLCGTVNDFVAEVGKAYERATENKEEADAMAKKVNLEAF